MIHSQDSDIIVWLDSKTGDKISEENFDKMLEEIQYVAQKYDFDFYQAGTVKEMKESFGRLEAIGYFEYEGVEL